MGKHDHLPTTGIPFQVADDDVSNLDCGFQAVQGSEVAKANSADCKSTLQPSFVTSNFVNGLWALTTVHYGLALDTGPSTNKEMFASLAHLVGSERTKTWGESGRKDLGEEAASEKSRKPKLRTIDIPNEKEVCFWGTRDYERSVGMK